MARPPFAPTADQQPVLAELAELAEQRTTVETKTDKLMARARELDIPWETIAAAAGHTRKTVLRRLGHDVP